MYAWNLSITMCCSTVFVSLHLQVVVYAVMAGPDTQWQHVCEQMVRTSMFLPFDAMSRYTPWQVAAECTRQTPQWCKTKVRCDTMACFNFANLLYNLAAILYTCASCFVSCNFDLLAWLRSSISTACLSRCNSMCALHWQTQACVPVAADVMWASAGQQVEGCRPVHS